MSEITAPRLETAIRASLAPALREAGFSGSGRTFRRTQGSWVQVVNVQGSRSGGSFAINLAVNPLAIPNMSGSPTDPKKITEELCEFRRRLSETGGDHWWRHDLTSESMLSAVEEATAMYRRTGDSLLKLATGPLSGFNALSAAVFSNGSYNVGGFGSTKVRMALALARLRKSEGNLEEAKAFAAYGLAHVGSATLLRKDLEALAAPQ